MNKSFFKCANASSAIFDRPKIYFLDEQFRIVQEERARTFVVKKRHVDGFSEFFGVLNDPKAKIPDGTPVPNIPFVSEGDEDLYKQYGLDEDLTMNLGGKSVPLYVAKDFLKISPASFAGVERTRDQIASNASKRRLKMFQRYKELDQRHVKSLSEINCGSVAYLYSYLNDGEPWQEGMEYYGYVDGLWETGSYLTVSVDTTRWSLHTAIHELGHSVSYFLTDQLFDKWVDIAIDKSEQPPSEYGKTEISEDFAETYGYYFSSVANERDSLAKKCPKRFEYMKKLDALGDTGLVHDMRPSKALSKRFARMDAVVYK